MQLTEAQLIEQILAAHREAAEGAPGVTVTEIADATSWHPERVRRVIRPLIRSGLVECSNRGVRTAIDGRRSRVPVYQMVRREAS